METRFKKRFITTGVVSALAALLIVGGTTAAPDLTPIEELGEFLYFDEDLSEPSGQACASCQGNPIRR